MLEGLLAPVNDAHSYLYNREVTLNEPVGA